METIKTAVVVVLLLGVLYGVYVVLNKRELAPPPDVAVEPGDLNAPDIQIGPPTEPGATDQVALMQSNLGPAGSESDAPTFPVPSALGSVSDGATSFRMDDDPAPDADAAHLSVYQQGLPPESQQGEAAGTSEFAATPKLVPPMDLPPSAAPGAPQDGGTDLATVDTIADTGTDSNTNADSAGSLYAPPNPEDDANEFRSIRAFDNAWNSALSLIEQKQWSVALVTLSQFYDDPELSFEERQRLVDLLDPLAGKVIYSSEHTLRAAHEVQPGETLQQIADQYQVPVVLLQRINGIADPAKLQPGTRLKVVPGPFRAEVDLDDGELILFAGKYYAGRFPLSLGNDAVPQPNEYVIHVKQEGHEYVTADGRRLAAQAAGNPYGRYWLDLGDNISLHSSPEDPPSHGGFGSISLSTADAADVYGILSVGSRVLVR